MFNAFRKPSWLLFRVLGAAMFMTHGYPKLFGENAQPFRYEGMTTVNIGDVIIFEMPMFINALFIAGVIEFVGGALILIGFLTRLTAFLAALLMVMAYLTAHLAWFPTLNNGELAAMYFLMFFLLSAYGPGPISVDAMLSRRRRPPGY